jgi:hypothetical protein
MKILIHIAGKIKKMLPSKRIQNGGWIQHGVENVFFFQLKISKWWIIKKTVFAIFLTKNTTVNIFFSKNLNIE